jgi:hypothetical protein
LEVVILGNQLLDFRNNSSILENDTLLLDKNVSLYLQGVLNNSDVSNATWSFGTSLSPVATYKLNGQIIDNPEEDCNESDSNCCDPETNPNCEEQNPPICDDSNPDCCDPDTNPDCEVEEPVLQSCDSWNIWLTGWTPADCNNEDTHPTIQSQTLCINLNQCTSSTICDERNGGSQQAFDDKGNCIVDVLGQ